VTALIPGLPDSAAIPPVGSVQPLVDALVADPRMGPHVGVLVQDQLTGEVLGFANQYSFFTPASTQKLLTGVAALYELDPDERLATRVLQDGSRLILVGGGDMLLAAGAGNGVGVDEHAGIGDLAALTAAKLALEGRTAVTLQIDDSLFSEPRIAPAVPAGEQRIFVAPVASMAVNQARADNSKSDSAPRVTDPAMTTAQVFTQAMAEHGITVDGRPSRVEGSVATIPEIARVESATIHEITEWAMQRSDNTITEVLARLVAHRMGLPTSAEGSVEAIKAVMAQLGVDMTGANLVDLSGLGRGSALTPRQLNDVVNVAIVGPPRLRELANGMPIGGMTGTLTERFVGHNYATGFVRAKTGSLPGVTALNGTVVTANNRMLLFAVVADQTPGPGQWGARQALDAFVSSLASLGSGA
jgi:D-alanyl-D-alanine carboxypeptidase/D-alanyl-D-alanine-endopeptidase (penicillin-binding protein 4)